MSSWSRDYLGYTNFKNILCYVYRVAAGRLELFFNLNDFSFYRIIILLTVIHEHDIELVTSGLFRPLVFEINKRVRTSNPTSNSGRFPVPVCTAYRCHWQPVSVRFRIQRRPLRYFQITSFATSHTKNTKSWLDDIKQMVIIFYNWKRQWVFYRDSWVWAGKVLRYCNRATSAVPILLARGLLFDTEDSNRYSK